MVVASLNLRALSDLVHTRVDGVRRATGASLGLPVVRLITGVGPFVIGCLRTSRLGRPATRSRTRSTPVKRSPGDTAVADVFSLETDAVVLLRSQTGELAASAA